MKVTARERVYAWDHDTGENLEKVRFIQRRKVDAKPGKTARAEAFHSQASRENGVEIHHTVHVQTFGRNAPKANPKQVSKVYMYQSAHASTAVDTVKHNRYSNQNDHNGIAVYPRRLTAKRKQK